MFIRKRRNSSSEGKNRILQVDKKLNCSCFSFGIKTKSRNSKISSINTLSFPKISLKTKKLFTNSFRAYMIFFILDRFSHCVLCGFRFFKVNKKVFFIRLTTFPFNHSRKSGCKYVSMKNKYITRK